MTAMSSCMRSARTASSCEGRSPRSSQRSVRRCTSAPALVPTTTWIATMTTALVRTTARWWPEAVAFTAKVASATTSDADHVGADDEDRHADEGAQHEGQVRGDQRDVERFPLVARSRWPRRRRPLRRSRCRFWRNLPRPHGERTGFVRAITSSREVPSRPRSAGAMLRRWRRRAQRAQPDPSPAGVGVGFATRAGVVGAGDHGEHGGQLLGRGVAADLDLRAL